MSPLILTLELDPAGQLFFERLRRAHYPAALNRIPAHLTLFHQLPEHAVALVEQAAQLPWFPLQVNGLRMLGRGVAFTLASDVLLGLHAELSATFAADLIPQDRHKFSPHIVIQNKVAPDAARKLLARLEQEFTAFAVQATGLRLWRYRNGPWDPAHFFPFRSSF